jgi:CubicO group peptidase (beta-lactamase class C family)
MKLFSLAAVCALMASVNLAFPFGAVAADADGVFDGAALDQMLDRAVKTGEVVGVSALVFDGGEVVYEGAYGMRDRERGKPVELDSVFRIYSMTKPITSAIIMDLEEDGLLNIKDPAAKYIPELADMQVMSVGEDGKPAFAPQKTPMTIEDLLLHRAGLGYGIFGPIHPVGKAYGEAGLFDPVEDLGVKMTKLSKLPLIAQPGTSWYYSYSIDVLGRIAEVVTGKSLYEVMNARIFTPLGMHETSFSVSADQRPRFASNYFRKDDGSYVLQEDGQDDEAAFRFMPSAKFQSGGGGLVSTLHDYAKFAEMMLNKGEYRGHRVLHAATVERMMTNHLTPDTIYMLPWIGGKTNNGFGYGGSIVVNDTPEQIADNGQITGHWGWNGAARTTFWIDPANGAFAIMMLQFFGGDDPDIHKRFRKLVTSEVGE